MLVVGLYVAGEQWGGVACAPGVGGAEYFALVQDLTAYSTALRPEESMEHVHCGGRIGYCCVRIWVVQSQAVKECGQVVGATVEYLLGKVNGVNKREELVLVIVSAGHAVDLSNDHF